MNWLFNIKLIYSVAIVFSSFINADLITTIEQQFPIAKPFFSGLVAEKEQRLVELKQQKSLLLKEKSEFDARTNLRLEELKTQLPQSQRVFEQNPDDEYSKQQFTLLNEMYQVIKDLHRTQDSFLALINDFIKILTDYVEDPTFLAYQKEQKLRDRLYYSFEDLQKLYEVTIDQQKQIEQLFDQKRNSNIELDNEKRFIAQIQEDYRKKKDELESAGKSAQQMLKGKKYERQQLADLLSFEQQYYEYRQQLGNIKIALTKMQEELVGVKLMIAEGRLTILNSYVRKVKQSVRISEVDIESAQENFDKSHQLYFSVKETQSKELEHISELRIKKEKELDLLSAQYGFALGSSLDDWTQEFQQSADWCVRYSQLGVLNAQVLLLKKQQELIEGQIALENERLKYEISLVNAKKTYYKILVNKFLTEDEINNEIKTYEASKADARSFSLRYKERVLLIPDLLNNKKKVVENIKKMRQEVVRQKGLAFAAHNNEYEKTLEALDAAQAKIHDYIDVLGKLTVVYSEISGNSMSVLRVVDFIITELRSITFWYRPDYAISWQDLSNIVPDITSFFFYVRSYVSRINVSSFILAVIDIGKQPLSLVGLFLKLFLVALTLILGFKFGRTAQLYLMHRIDLNKGLLRALTILSVALLTFLTSHAIGISTLILFFFLLKYQVVSELALYIFFYLGSIPYLLYLANSFLGFFAKFNEENKYIFLAEDFQDRFFAVTSIFLYATIVIVFFREAFMLVNYYGSALPTILLAINFIIFQIALILLISKEQIVHLISSNIPFWQWIREQMEVYFYHFQMLVIAIIIMSNPYVGYGRLVLYSFFCLLYTGLLVMSLFWLYGFFKRKTSYVFFMTDEEVVRERFPNAKMWFGLFIITSFLILFFIGVIIGAKIWGRPITYLEIYRWFTHPITHSGNQEISLISFFAILAFIIGGVLTSQAFNHYVLDKIFDLLLVDAGVQHTVTSIASYVFFFIALFLGLNQVGLGSFLGWAFAALTFSLGWVLKDPISDFIAYFIILVQRPIKIGDYIKIEGDITGVVRRISVRSVVLRRRNSTTVVVPNSYVISHVVTNWNYVRGFIAFDDILLTIDYREDPSAVRELLLSVVESHPNILRTPRSLVRLENFGEYGFNFLIRGFMSSSYTLDQWDIASNIRLCIARALREKNIKIALPVRMIISSGEPVDGINTK